MTTAVIHADTYREWLWEASLLCVNCEMVPWRSCDGPERCFVCADCARQIPDTSRAMREALRRLIDRIRTEACVECGQPLTGREQIGSWVYGRPCGHRQYKGDVRTPAGARTYCLELPGMTAYIQWR